MTVEDLQPLNVHDDEELVDSPVFDDPAEALAYMDEQQANVVAELEDEARRLMELDSGDPTQQSYYMRTDRRTVVKTEQEFVQCQINGVQMKIVSYATAMHLVVEEDARARRAVKEKRKKKAAKQARKRNR